MSNKIADLDIKKVYPNPDQPRKEFDSQSIQELASSIKSQGLLQPIVVIPRKNGYMIVSGERRYKAHLLNGALTIQAIVRADMISSTKEEVKIKAVIENVIRKDMTPIEEAIAYKELLETMSLDDLATAIGLAKFRIVWRVKLLNMIPSAQQAFNDGDLTMTQSRLLGELDPNKQETLLAMIQDGKCSTDAKLKAAKQHLLSKESTQNVLELNVTSDRDGLQLKNKLTKVSFELSEIASNFQDISMSPDFIQDNQAILENLIKTAKALQKKIYPLEIKSYGAKAS